MSTGTVLCGLEVCSLSKAQIRSLDYAVSCCYRKIFHVKSNENVRLCMDMFNCDDVATLLTKKVCRQLCPNWQYTVRTGSRSN